MDFERYITYLQDGGGGGETPPLIRRHEQRDHICGYAYYSLPSVWFPWRVCLPGDLQGSAGAAEVLPPRSHQGYSLSALTPRPGCPLRR